MRTKDWLGSNRTFCLRKAENVLQIVKYSVLDASENYCLVHQYNFNQIKFVHLLNVVVVLLMQVEQWITPDLDPSCVMQVCLSTGHGLIAVFLFLSVAEKFALLCYLNSLHCLVLSFWAGMGLLDPLCHNMNLLALFEACCKYNFSLTFPFWNCHFSAE